MTMNDGTCLKFYVAESRRHHGVLVYEWLLREAVKLGLPGGSAFRAIAGFGRHHRMHEQHFFELAGDVPVEIVFFVDADEEARLLNVIEAEGLTLFFARQAASYGVINGRD
jgi:PII-like signaling protein